MTTRWLSTGGVPITVVVVVVNAMISICVELVYELVLKRGANIYIRSSVLFSWPAVRERNKRCLILFSLERVVPAPVGHTGTNPPLTVHRQETAIFRHKRYSKLSLSLTRSFVLDR